jgi:cardiolipin synthase
VVPLPVWQGRLLSPLKHNHRTHRKVLVCDEVVGFTGGVGIAEEWCGDARDEHEWRDTHVRVTGPAVDGLSASFAQNWAETGHPLIDDDRRFPEHARTEGGSCVQVARGSASVGWNDMATVFRVMLESAQERLRMMTAYFVPDDCFQQLMLDAVQRGVQVDVMLPGRTPTSGSASWPASRSTRRWSRAACASGPSSRRCCTPRC